MLLISVSAACCATCHAGDLYRVSALDPCVGSQIGYIPLCLKERPALSRVGRMPVGVFIQRYLYPFLAKVHQQQAIFSLLSCSLHPPQKNIVHNIMNNTQTSKIRTQNTGLLSNSTDRVSNKFTLYITPQHTPVSHTPPPPPHSNT